MDFPQRVIRADFFDQVRAEKRDDRHRHEIGCKKRESTSDNPSALKIYLLTP